MDRLACLIGRGLIDLAGDEEEAKLALLPISIGCKLRQKGQEGGLVSA